MENKYKINFKKYREHCGKNHIVVPSWMNHFIFVQVLGLMGEGKKLQACKYLCDKSAEFNTRQDFGLKWSKDMVCDIIDNFKIIPAEPIKTLTIPNLINLEEVREILAPFKALADEVLSNPNLDRDQTIYAYNKAQITMADLRRVNDLFKRIDVSFTRSGDFIKGASHGKL